MLARVAGVPGYRISGAWSIRWAVLRRCWFQSSYNFSIEICMNESHLVTISNSTLVKQDLPGRTDHVIRKVYHTILIYHFDSS